MKKNRFPGACGIVVLGLAGALLALAGVVYAGGTIEKKQPVVSREIALPGQEYILKVIQSRGVSGYPAMGTVKYQKGRLVKYYYSPADPAADLVVKLDGVEVAASGGFLMNSSHTLEAFTNHVRKYRLKVMETYYQNDIPCYAGTGACRHEGTPACGESKFAAGAVISYDLWQNWGQIAGVYLAAYPPTAGCPPSLRDLGGMAPGEHLTGSFVMDRDYTLVLSINIE